MSNLVKVDGVEFDDNYVFHKSEKVYHRYVNNTRYWIVVCISDDTLLRIEVHGNDICELFTHSRMREYLTKFTEYKQSKYKDIIDSVVSAEEELSKLEFLDSNESVKRYYTKIKVINGFMEFVSKINIFSWIIDLYKLVKIALTPVHENDEFSNEVKSITLNTSKSRRLARDRKSLICKYNGRFI